ncbi:MAG: hypothetical protein ABI051_08180 [Vicinamibacterales bacterium]
MNTVDLVNTLREFHRDRLTLRERHVGVARLIVDYDFNNTYQYIIAREDVHVAWIEAALADLGAEPDQVPAVELPPRSAKETITPLISHDAREAEAFVTRWRPRLADMNNARHRNLMGVVIGETLEQKRFFDQMLAGREDLLGRRSNGAGSPGTGDGVMSVRWIE